MTLVGKELTTGDDWIQISWLLRNLLMMRNSKVLIKTYTVTGMSGKNGINIFDWLKTIKDLVITFQ